MNIQIKIVTYIYISFISIVSFADPIANLTLKVIDEGGNPVEAASANVVFYSKLSAGKGWGESSNSVIKQTDAEGVSEFSSETSSHVYYGAFKSGYYNSSYQLEFEKANGIIGFRTWLPNNPVLIVPLKKKINPISLYAKAYISGGALLTLPEYNKPFGYDLLVGDWVVPYGKGSHRDLIFELKGDIKSNREFDLTLTLNFSNPDDGILIYDADPKYGSELKLPYHAPLEGYSPKLEQRYARLPDKFIANNFPENRNYYFRVRSKVNESGEIISALYGKIYGNISFSRNKHIYLTYYLNPQENNRNLEFDISKNLFGNLKYDQKVIIP